MVSPLNFKESTLFPSISTLKEATVINAEVTVLPTGTKGVALGLYTKKLPNKFGFGATLKAIVAI